ncbi:AAA family ATPase [Frondihabitans sp. PAMC 28766]|uniref:UvrD-helicase domain-containing protein n=1 Tax=Frondihabitans sp. PAMC 28766 TaxID=1795630 RepID=UPI00078CB25B|nr:UvrD-helicase domain-containing protein [Frondihabitans sp. PAMC 28766]AMM20534.1 AAA family ATPase [Frondihabitans sp. PAMC 28766]
MPSELDRERDYVSTLYERLDELKAEARERLTATRRETVGGNHQSRSERDAYARLYEDTLAQLGEVDDRLAFGRLELEEPDDTTSPQRGDGIHRAVPDSGAYRYIGRIGLRDRDHHPILLDWRVPGASAFYQATAATPMGARARRHLTLEGRTVTRIEDEVFDPTLLDRGDAQLQGEGALMAALTAQRTGRMSDIVATIQAEQDRIIRSQLDGILVVQGGPGTGKTAVALHRAAYLLYSHRERLRGSGVLVVGPSRSFLRYIEQVLPSLGESGVVLSSLGGLYPDVEATTDDAPEVAALKGSGQMADLLKRAVRSRQVAPAADSVVDIDGERMAVQPQLVADALRRAQERGKPHNDGRVLFNRYALSALTRQLIGQLRDRGTTIDDADELVLREDVRQSYDVRVLLNTAWIPLTPQKLLEDLYARPNWLASITQRWSPEQRALLRRGRGEAFTISDVPLLDEAAELLGEFDTAVDADRRARKQQQKRDIENAERAIENMQVEGLVSAGDIAGNFAERAASMTTAERAAGDRTWAFGHVVVDEAQELSPMQWRLLARRCPLRSFTVVGDIAQASSPASATSWDRALQGLLPRRRGAEGPGGSWRLEELTVNYRTPSQIVDYAEATAKRNGLEITPSRSVRSSEWRVREVAPSAGQDAIASVVDAVAFDRAIDSGGTLAVIAPEALVAPLVRALADVFPGAVSPGTASLTTPISVLSTAAAKGLEFDAVVVVDPDGILRLSSRGNASLYVAMTRPTQRLTVVSVS